MDSYTRKINESTFNVAFKGVRIGNAKRTRLAQINLKSKIITFSRYAIENVPERGRRYLVIHELAHVIEPSHNKKFWALVKRYEPDYKIIEKQLEQAFVKNVKQANYNEKKKIIKNDPGLFSVAEDLTLSFFKNESVASGGFVKAVQLKFEFTEFI